MRINDLLKRGLDSAEIVVKRLLNGLPDASWDLQPHPACQALNWQFGHLILSEATMIEGSLRGSILLDIDFQQAYRKPELPVEDGGSVENDKTCDAESRPAIGSTVVSPTEGRLSPTELWTLYHDQRQRTLGLLENLSSNDLEAAAAESIRDYCPTVADAFIACSCHWMMHTGQWVILRRMAGLPIVL